MWLQPAAECVQQAYSFMEHLFIYCLFLFIHIYSSILKFYRKEFFSFVIKYNILCSVWEDEEMDHKLFSLFFPNFKFLQALCNMSFFQNCLKHILAVLLSKWGGHKCNGEGWIPCNYCPKPGMENGTVTLFLWGN